MKQIIGGLVLGCLFAMGPAAPAAAEDSDRERIERLERRVAELEAALARALEASSLADTAELKRRIEMLTEELEKAKLGEAARPRRLESMHGLGPAASKVYGSERGVSVGGYGELLFQDFDARRDDGTRTGKASEFDLLRAVLYFGYKFNDKIVFNSEIEFEHASTEDDGEVSVEFATVDFLLHPAASVRAGLVLMPVGFINEMHEPPVFLGARRPDVERSVLPATWRENGVGLFGEAGDFEYRAYVVNGFDASGFSGSGLRGGRQDGSEAEARDIAFTARVDYRGVPGLLVGGSLYTGDSGQGGENAAGDVIDGTITLYDLHAQYENRGLHLRGLWTSTQVDDAGEISTALVGLDPNVPAEAAMGVGSRITGWYAEAGYDVLAAFGDRTEQALVPFVRYERFDTQDRMPAGFTSTGANDVRVVTYGASYEPIPSLAVKVEFQDFERGDGSGTDQINVALGYLF